MPSITEVLPGFLDLGEWTTLHIRPLFDLFRNENVAPALALIIFGTALLLCFLFIVDSTYIRIQVRRRTHALGRIKSKLEFADQLAQVERTMLSSRYLRHSWQKFRETLIEPPLEQDGRGPRVVLNTARPQNYFNTAEAGLRFPLYRAMPNLLVGIGLLLTFFGLVSALFFTTVAIRNAADLSVSQDALRSLLYAASFKFYTSIAGLAGSIALTLVLRHGTSALEKSFDALASTLESKLVFVTPESIAFDHYREAQEQTRNLKLFNTEVAISVGKRIEEALAATLPGYLAQAMAPIGRSLDEVATKLTSMNEGAIGEMAGSFATKLQGVTGEHMQGLASTLTELRASLEEMNSSMNTSGLGLVSATKSFEAVSDRMAGRIEEAVNAVTVGLVSGSSSVGEKVAQAAIGAAEESRGKVVDAGTDLAEMLSGIGHRLNDAVTRMEEGLTGAVREISNIERSISEHVVSMNSLSKATMDTEDAISRSARTLREAGEPLAQSSRLIAEATTKIAGANESSAQAILNAQATIQSIGQLLENTLQVTSKQWEAYEQHFQGVDDSLGIILDRIIKSVQDNLEALRGFVEKVDEKLAGAVDKLGGGVNELGDFAQSMEQLTARLNGTNRTVNDQVRG